MYNLFWTSLQSRSLDVVQLTAPQHRNPALDAFQNLILILMSQTNSIIAHVQQYLMNSALQRYNNNNNLLAFFNNAQKFTSDCTVWYSIERGTTELYSDYRQLIN